MTERDGATPVAQQGPSYFHTSQQPLNDANTTDNQFAREWNFIQLLKGAATFIRIVARADCQLWFWNENEKKLEQYYEGLVAERGLVANVPLLIRNENWQKIKVIGAAGTVVSVYASRIPDTNGGVGESAN